MTALTTLGCIVLVLGIVYFIYVVRTDLELERLRHRVNRLEERLAAANINNAVDHEKFHRVIQEMCNKLHPMVEAYEYEQTLKSLTS